MKINREYLLAKLEGITPGLTTKAGAGVAQGDHFVFDGTGKVLTFNDDVAGRVGGLKFDPPIKGAVFAPKLLEVLQKFEDEDVDVAQKNGHLVVRGKGRRESGIVMNNDPVPDDFRHVDPPAAWVPVAGEFADAVAAVCPCAGRLEGEEFVLSCVHIHPKRIEASDNYQIARWQMETHVTEPVLVLGRVLKKVVDLGVLEFSETPTWLHFKTALGAVLSCRRFREQYEDTESVLEVTGTKIVLPKGIAAALEKAKIFSEDQAEGDLVRVDLTAGEALLTGTGAKGYYRQPVKVDYAGPALSFRMSPEILKDVAEKFSSCVVSKKMLKARLGAYEYATLLIPTEKDRGEGEEEAS